MIIRCKKSKRFLCDIDIENYLSNLDHLGISQEIPLRLTVPCRLCKEVEVYNVYRTHYDFIENKDRDISHNSHQ